MKNIITLFVLLTTLSCQTDSVEENLCVEMPIGYYSSEMTNRVLYIDITSNYAEVQTNVVKQYQIFIEECQVEVIDNQGSIYFDLDYSVDTQELVWFDGITYNLN